MSSQAHADRLAKALEQTNICQAVLSEFKGDQIRLLLRVAKEADSLWVKMVDRILTAQDDAEDTGAEWQSHICKNYFHKLQDDGTRKLVFGWYISIQAVSMTDALDRIVRAIKGVVPAKKEERKKEVEEMPLGINHDLNVPTDKRKGAWTVGGKNDFQYK